MQEGLIGRLAERLAQERLNELVDRSVALLLAAEPEYRAVSSTQLYELMRRTIALTLLRLSRSEPTPELASAAYESGQLRATQGIELSSVLRSFRIDLRVIWEALIEEATRLGITQDESLVDGTLDVWEAVEANIADMVEGYRVAAEQLRRGAAESRADAFSGLLATGEHDDAAVQLAARVLGMPVEGRYLCVVADVAGSHPGALVALEARLRQRSIPSHLDHTADGIVAIVAIDGHTVAQTIALLHELSSLPAGAFDVASLRDVPRGLRLARQAIGDGIGISLIRDTWTRTVTASADGELIATLALEIFAPLRQTARTEAAMVDTIRAYFAGDGSVADIAKRTYRHRNTVRARMRELERLTGLDLGRPRDIATLGVAWQAAELAGERQASRHAHS